jgi:aldehyde dehydrogenase (NAD+)
MSLIKTIEKQRQFSTSGQAKDIHFRIQQLQKLKDLLKANEELLFIAIYNDFKKSKFETYLTELAMVYKEIDEAICKVAKWSRAQKVKTDLALQPAKSFILPEPFGNVLIIGAWNYPYNLTFAPLVAAMAAGNTCIVKPSELPAHTSAAMAQ